ncbi:MAG TPA: helix-turn-helix transcriptional regulator [Thermoanaerobaculia bacterium]
MNSSELRSRRIHLELGRTDLACEMGIDVQTVAAWESGEVSIDSPHLLDRALRTRV